ncbi:hypothetical protein DWW57_12070 [Odoribacter splanchnicus]|uniref:Uncharacterized protein n=1 Tax=Odoribacter splanchnicus TaxID=28118 RepID=A0A412TNX5_9BACT|nr:hypothetical protein DWW57_12070 [Odoribacter splanchnicus]
MIIIWKLRFHQERNKERKMRKETKKAIVDYQSDIKRNYRLEDTLSIVNCSLAIYRVFMQFINFIDIMNIINFQLK